MSWHVLQWIKCALSKHLVFGQCTYYPMLQVDCQIQTQNRSNWAELTVFWFPWKALPLSLCHHIYPTKLLDKTTVKKIKFMHTCFIYCCFMSCDSEILQLKWCADSASGNDITEKDINPLLMHWSFFFYWPIDLWMASILCDWVLCLFDDTCRGPSWQLICCPVI